MAEPPEEEGWCEVSFLRHQLLPQPPHPPTSLPCPAPPLGRQWIGAIELGFVLDTLLGVAHRVLTAPSGDEVPGLARQIAHHFDTQGGCGGGGGGGGWGVGPESRRRSRATILLPSTALRAHPTQHHAPSLCSHLPVFARKWLPPHPPLNSAAGTPIMIGGGVLAYTLLGIDWDEHSGRCAFLILDPHYTGAEDIKKIHAGAAGKAPGWGRGRGR